MKLLIITQKVDRADSNLGFFHHWLEKFAGKVEKLYVVCLAKGEHSLPDNVEVFSLGKENGYSKIAQFFRLQKFLWRNLGKVDGVFFHMCPIYVILSYPMVKIFRKKTGLWYLHRSLNWKFKLAAKMADIIFTASEESCGLKDRKKIQVIGHGIDTEMFMKKALGSFQLKGTECLFLLYVGRIAPIKNLETLVEAVDILVHQKKVGVKAVLVGEPVDSTEKQYSQKIEQLVMQKNLQDVIMFKGKAVYSEMPQVYQKADILVNLCPTGGLDKAVLEAMASGILVLVANGSFKQDFGCYADMLIFRYGDSCDLANKICFLQNSADVGIVGNFLRERVVKFHNLDNLIDKIISFFNA